MLYATPCQTKANDWTLLKDQPAASSFVQKQDKEK